jgi:RNA polymerase sigma factor (sigma-70 family)
MFVRDPGLWGMSTVPDKRATELPADVEVGDAEFIQLVRAGEIEAYGEIYARHVDAAYRFASQFSTSRQDVDDLVSETFAKVLDTLQAGRGPDTSFRPYLLTALRHVAYDANHLKRRQRPTEGIDTTEPFNDTILARLEQSLVTRAYSQLPERWQAVLWHTVIERESPAELAPIFGMSPNGVSALAYRAREGLKKAYLQAHISDDGPLLCTETVNLLGGWTRGSLGKRETTIVEGHLATCERCRKLTDELADINGGLRAVIAPLVLGAALFGYLAIHVDTPEFADFAWIVVATAAAAGLGRPNIRRIIRDGGRLRIATIASFAIICLVFLISLGRW